MDINNYLSKGLILDSYNLFIEWDIDKNRFLDKTKYIDVINIVRKDFNYCAYKIESNLLNSLQTFNVTFNFIKDKFSSVNISDNDCSIDSTDKYKLIQRFLEQRLGPPISKKEKCREVVSIWKTKKIKVTHSLIDRFGLQEILEIKIM